MSIETLVLIPTEFCLAPTQIQYENSLNKDEEKIQLIAVHSEQYIAKGTRFLPFQGTVQMGRFPMEPFLSEHNVSNNNTVFKTFLCFCNITVNPSINRYQLTLK